MPTRKANRDSGSGAHVDAMFRKILVPLDGSLWAENVLPHAINLADKRGSSLVLMQVSGAPSIAMMQEVENYDTVSAEQDYARRSYYLTSIAKRIKAASFCGVTTLIEQAQYDDLTDDGAVSSSICSAAVRIRADAIVMATHGLSGVRRFFLGSIASLVVRQAPMPVILVRPHAAQQQVAEAAYQPYGVGSAR